VCAAVVARSASYSRVRTVGDRHRSGDSVRQLGSSEYDTGNFAEAETAYLHADQLIAHAFPGIGFLLIHVRVNLADLYRQMGRLADAETYAASDVAQAVAAFGEEHPQTVLVRKPLFARAS